MKHIIISQRVDIFPSYHERRDALDQKWASLLREIGAILFPIPNDHLSAVEFLKSLSPDGIVLTGGNSPLRYGGDAPERDEIDILLIKYAVTNKIPLIGVCRGMQSIILYFGGTLKKLNGHVGISHKIKGRINRTVNSYHNLVPDNIPSCFEILADSEDGSAECIKHLSMPILGLMWHPEREKMFDKKDVILFKKMLNYKEKIL